MAKLQLVNAIRKAVELAGVENEFEVQALLVKAYNELTLTPIINPQIPETSPQGGVVFEDVEAFRKALGTLNDPASKEFFKTMPKYWCIQDATEFLSEEQKFSCIANCDYARFRIGALWHGNPWKTYAPASIFTPGPDTSLAVSDESWQLDHGVLAGDLIIDGVVKWAGPRKADLMDIINAVYSELRAQHAVGINFPWPTPTSPAA